MRRVVASTLAAAGGSVVSGAGRQCGSLGWSKWANWEQGGAATWGQEYNLGAVGTRQEVKSGEKSGVGGENGWDLSKLCTFMGGQHGDWSQAYPYLGTALYLAVEVSPFPCHNPQGEKQCLAIAY